MVLYCTVYCTVVLLCCIEVYCTTMLCCTTVLYCCDDLVEVVRTATAAAVGLMECNVTQSTDVIPTHHASNSPAVCTLEIAVKILVK